MRTCKFCITGLQFAILLLTCIQFSYAQSRELSLFKQQLQNEKDSLKYVDLLNKISFNMHMSNADSCLHYGIRAKAMAARLNYENGKAEAMGNIGAAFSLKGIHNQSLRYYAAAQTIYRRNHDIAAEAKMLMNSAITYSFLGNAKRRDEFALQALALGKKVPYDKNTAILYANYVNITPGLAPAAAAAYLDRSEAIAVRNKDDRAILYLNQIRADRLLQGEHPELALPYIHTSLKMASGHQWDYYQLGSLDLRALYEQRTGKTPQAIQTLLQIKDIAVANDFHYWNKEVLQSLLTAYKAQGDNRRIQHTQEEINTVLQQEVASSNAFISDYIAYINTQEKLRHLERVNASGRQKVIWLSATVFLILTLLIFAIVFNEKLKKNSRMLARLNYTVNSQNQSLMASDDLKGKLISMLAHDFRAPVGSTLSIVGLLKEKEEMPQEELDRFYKQIEQDLNQLLFTFDNILDWIRKQLSGYTFMPGTIMLAGTMDQTASLIRHAFSKKRLKFENLIDPSFQVESDLEIIQFLNRNLVHNALKFSPEGGTITVSSREEGGEIIISIADQGPGIKENDLDKVFYFNPDRASIDKGAGIALNICREMTAKINGRIWAERRPGGGSIFNYALPVSC